MAESMRDLLLQLSDSAFDHKLHPYLRRWSDPPTALQVLEVLDLCVFGSLTSDFVVGVLQVYYGTLLEQEGKTHEDLVPLATWRQNHG